MLAESSIISTLLFSAICYPLITYQFRDNIKNKSAALFWAIAIVCVFISVKLAFDLKDINDNYYSHLEIGRHSSTLDIRKAYKKLSKIYHPDKKSDSLAEDKFHKIKEAYDVLMDESQRDVYNRFGQDAITFDPRKDEIKLLSDIATKYLFWLFIGYIMTLPSGARSSRTWIAIVGIALLAGEISLCLTEVTMPTFMPSFLTEYELISLLHLLFPCLIVLLRCLSEYLYVDVETTSINVLNNISEHQKCVKELLEELANTMVDNNNNNNNISDINNNDALKEKILVLKNQIETTNDDTTKQILLLKNSSSNPGANYYWIIFVIIYGGIYLIQQ